MKPILEAGRNCWSVDEVTEAGLLIDGRDYYRELYRAACAARRSIYIAGWQFDSDVALLRGEDLREAEGPVTLLAFLNHLCETRPELEVRILAWDFSVVYAFEREWFQRLIFLWTTHERLTFRPDGSHPLGGSHHQKLVVVDGEIGFVGGMDVCAHRWDDRRHAANDPERHDSDDVAYGPYHEVQAYLRGPAVAKLTELFRERWYASGGGELAVPEPADAVPVRLRPTLPLPARRAALSRTRGASIVPLLDPLHETREQFLDAIASAERLLYVETQYFSADAICNALVARMEDATRAPPEIVILLPSKAWAVVEAVAVGFAQNRVLHRLREVAARTGAPLGIYCTTHPGSETQDACTFIHSKVVCVDDRFLCVASANFTNRSMGLDSELNVSWEAAPGDRALERAIARARISLLAEHCGVTGPAQIRRIAEVPGLVSRLDALAQAREHRLRLHQGGTEETAAAVPEGLRFDAEQSILHEPVYEKLASDRDSLLARGVTLLNKLLIEKKGEPSA